MAEKKTKKTEQAQAPEVEQVQAVEEEQVQAPEVEDEPEMVKVVVKTRFKDKECGKKLRRVGEAFEVTKARYEEIVAAGEAKGVTYVAPEAE